MTQNDYFGIPKGFIPLAGYGAAPHYQSIGDTAFYRRMSEMRKLP